MKVAAIQMVSGTRLDDNLAQARALLEQAREAGAELAVLPEYFCFMGRHDADKLRIAEPPGAGPIQAFLSRAAADFGLWVVGGTLPLATSDPAHAANATLVFGPDGQPVARYDKIHLFRYDNGRERYDEAAVLAAGDTPTAFTLTDAQGQAWRVGLSVCYDLRFPELYRLLGADLLLVPAAFTHTTGQAHWEVLLRARAIENQAYVLASAQGGSHENGRQTWGQSMVIDPWGVVLAQRASGAGVVVADIAMSRLQQVRQQLPALQHRRF
ncbi:carbon-nitrogen hydrolase family protein [Tepidicella xavieri]|jgi:nitrilase|uniref:Nitrilase n=1 Tax=Tepidicella xavieri TaxID=360241 RepID=A0A4R6UCC5_9BURK|nr:carbon-nitrogen hydrolase family protein [Tepidicella xavieri]TDQ44350.1 nitrilase [Tepidicella xavieri]